MTFGDWDAAGLVANVGWGGVVLIVVLLVLRGRLITRTSHLDRIADKDRQLSDVQRERDDWKAASTAKDTTIAELTNQLGEALEAGRVATAVMAALPKAAGNG